jgi:hypothetical protein
VIATLWVITGIVKISMTSSTSSTSINGVALRLGSAISADAGDDVDMIHLLFEATRGGRETGYAP